MKTSIEVESRKEALALQHGLAMPDVRAFVIVMATLDQLPSDRARQRVLRYVTDLFQDPTSWRFAPVEQPSEQSA